MGVNRFEMQACYCEPARGFPGGYAGMCPPGTEVGSYDEGVAEFCAQCEQNPCAECVANPPYAKRFTSFGPSSWEPTPGTVAGGIGSSLCFTDGIMHPYECYAIEPPPEGCSPPPPPPPPPSPPPPPVKPPKTTCKNGGSTDGTPPPRGGFPGGGEQ